jgi:hypothetical protein
VSRSVNRCTALRWPDGAPGSRTYVLGGFRCVARLEWCGLYRISPVGQRALGTTARWMPPSLVTFCDAGPRHDSEMRSSSEGHVDPDRAVLAPAPHTRPQATMAAVTAVIAVEVVATASATSHPR